MSRSLHALVSLGALAALALSVRAQGADPAAPAAPKGMVLVSAGIFAMGVEELSYDEAPRHAVHLDAFYVDRTEVTVGAFRAYVRAQEAYERVEGPYCRNSVGGALDFLAFHEERYGVRLSDFGSRKAALVGEKSKNR